MTKVDHLLADAIDAVVRVTNYYCLRQQGVNYLLCSAFGAMRQKPSTMNGKYHSAEGKMPIAQIVVG